MFLAIGVTSMSLLQPLYLSSIHPQHSFFGHLVGALGSREFSAPICMLLLEKSANRVTRQASADDVHASLSLPTSVFQHRNYSQQIYVRYFFTPSGSLFH